MACFWFLKSPSATTTGWHMQCGAAMLRIATAPENRGKILTEQVSRPNARKTAQAWIALFSLFLSMNVPVCMRWRGAVSITSHVTQRDAVTRRR